jgi:uncharacterized membrane protein required for colicin V production
MVKFMNGLNWLDIATIIVLAVFILDGLAKGFIWTLFDTLGFLASFYIAKELSAYPTNYISNNTEVYKKLCDYIGLKMQGNTAATVFNIINNNALSENALATAFIKMISFVMIFIVAKFLLHALAGVLNAAARLPVLRQFNRLGGFILGALKGVFMVYLILAVIFTIIPILDASNPLVKAVETSKFAVNFYKYNFIISFLNSNIQKVNNLY